MLALIKLLIAEILYIYIYIYIYTCIYTYICYHLFLLSSQYSEIGDKWKFISQPGPEGWRNKENKIAGLQESELTVGLI
jgi:hypothetical protein